MTMLDTLRKDYDKLTPFERASLIAEAVGRRDENAIDALQAPSLWDAFHCSVAHKDFLMLAAFAVTESLRADGALWAARLVMELEERKEEKADEAKLDKFLDLLHEAGRKRLAWVLALEALDDGNGTACLPLADIFAGGHASKMLEDAKGKDVCFEQELGTLKEIWSTMAPVIAGAPKPEEAPQRTTQ